MTHLTRNEVRTRLQLLGLTLQRVESEWRVTFAAPPRARRADLDRLEDMAAYCGDLEEALLTGCAMHGHRARFPAQYAFLAGGLH